MYHVALLQLPAKPVTNLRGRLPPLQVVVPLVESELVTRCWAFPRRHNLLFHPGDDVSIFVFSMSSTSQWFSINDQELQVKWMMFEVVGKRKKDSWHRIPAPLMKVRVVQAQLCLLRC